MCVSCVVGGIHVCELCGGRSTCVSCVLGGVHVCELLV